MKKIRPPFKCHGGKFYLSQWIIENMPENYQKFDYLEPFCGAASVFINKEPSEDREIINDLDKKVIAIMKTLRDEPEAFIKKVRNTTYSERVFKRELNRTEFESEFDIAFNEFVLRRMSRGGLKKAFAWSNRERGGQPGDVNAWKTIVKELPKISERLKKVFILNKPATEVINAFNYENMLCYCDPPYVPDSRTSKNTYECELDTDGHIALANALLKFKGKVILSGYQSTLYKRLYADWRCIKKKVANHASQDKTKAIKVECLWVNF